MAARREPTGAAWGHTSPPHTTPKRYFYLAAASMVALLGAAGAFWSKAQKPTSTNASTALSEHATPIAPTLMPSANATAIAVTVVPTELTASSSSVGADVEAKPASIGVDRSGQTNKGAKTTKSGRTPRIERTSETPSAPPAPNAPAAASKPNCDPPYTLDASGNKRFKRECYQN